MGKLAITVSALAIAVASFGCKGRTDTNYNQPSGQGGGPQSGHQMGDDYSNPSSTNAPSTPSTTEVDNTSGIGGGPGSDTTGSGSMGSGSMGSESKGDGHTGTHDAGSTGGSTGGSTDEKSGTGGSTGLGGTGGY